MHCRAKQPAAGLAALHSLAATAQLLTIPSTSAANAVATIRTAMHSAALTLAAAGHAGLDPLRHIITKLLASAAVQILHADAHGIIYHVPSRLLGGCAGAHDKVGSLHQAPLAQQLQAAAEALHLAPRHAQLEAVQAGAAQQLVERAAGRQPGRQGSGVGTAEDRVEGGAGSQHQWREYCHTGRSSGSIQQQEQSASRQSRHCRRNKASKVSSLLT